MSKLTEQIPLPSKGLLYPKSSPLSAGYVELKYMNASHEDILTNINYIKQGTVINKLLSSLLPKKVDELLVGDKNAVMIAARILGYGKDYNFSIRNPQDEKEKVNITIDLTKLPEKELDAKLIKSQENPNEFFFTLPNTGTEVSFRLLTSGDEDKIEEELKNLKQKLGTSPNVTTRLKHILLSVGGERDPKKIREFVDTLVAIDAKALRSYVNKITPNVELKYEYDFGQGLEEGSVPITGEFFWPE